MIVRVPQHVAKYSCVMWCNTARCLKMTSSNGNIFRVTGPLCGGIGEFPSLRPVTRSFGVFFDLRLNKRLSEASDLRRHHAHCDVTVMLSGDGLQRSLLPGVLQHPCPHDEPWRQQVASLHLPLQVDRLAPHYRLHPLYRLHHLLLPAGLPLLLPGRCR